MSGRVPMKAAACAAAIMALGASTLTGMAQDRTSLPPGTGGGPGGQASANMQVNASVIRKCTISTQPMSFGNYDPVQANASSPLDGQSTLTVACTKGTSVTIAMDDGANAQFNQRRMSDRRTYLRYEAYKDAGRTQRWGDREGERLDGGIAPSRDPRQFIVYGRVPGGQDVPEGVFQDTLVVTVQF